MVLVFPGVFGAVGMNLGQSTRNLVLPRCGLPPVLSVRDVTVSVPHVSYITILSKTNHRYSYSKRRVLCVRDYPTDVSTVPSQVDHKVPQLPHHHELFTLEIV